MDGCTYQARIKTEHAKNFCSFSCHVCIAMNLLTNYHNYMPLRANRFRPAVHLWKEREGTLKCNPFVSPTNRGCVVYIYYLGWLFRHHSYEKTDDDRVQCRCIIIGWLNGLLIISYWTSLTSQILDWGKKKNWLGGKNAKTPQPNVITNEDSF